MDYKKYNDNELIYMVHENDECSVNLLVEKYYPIIFNLSKEYYEKYKGNIYELDDFYQEALSAFYKAIYSYNGNYGTLFYTFVIVCIKRALSGFGKTVYNKNYFINNLDISELDYCIEDEKVNPNKRDLYIGLENVVKKVLFSLPLEASSILELRINGFTYKEIGVLLDIPISSVEFKSRRARNILRNKVNAYYCK